MRSTFKNDGLFYCFVPCEGDFLSLWNLLDKIGLKNDLTKKYAGHINYFSRKSLLNLLEKNGFIPIKKIYCEHLFGQLLGFFSFLAMDRFAKKNKLDQINNEKYFENLNKKSGISVIKNIVNAVVNFESVVFQAIPSPNVNLILKKK